MPTNTGQMIPRPIAGCYAASDVLFIPTRLVIGAAGAVDAVNTWSPAGVTVVKTAAQVGRYTFTLPAPYWRLLNVIVTPIGPDTVALGANTTGLDVVFRKDDISSAKNTLVPSVSNADGTIEMQLIQTSYADAEATSGMEYMVTFVVARSSAP